MAKGYTGKIEPGMETVLAEDIVFKGQLKFQESLQINGDFEGRIETTGHLWIGDKANVRAEILAKEVTISGKLEGNIQNSDRVELISRSVVNGDIHTKDITIESGSAFNGVCIMNPS